MKTENPFLEMSCQTRLRRHLINLQHLSFITSFYKIRYGEKTKNTKKWRNKTIFIKLKERERRAPF